MSSVYFAADLHLGHKNAHRFRTQFSSAEEHDDFMVRSVLLVPGKRNVLCNKVYSLVKYKGFWLSHAPIHPEELRGCKNIHGHCHDAVISDT